MSAGVIISYVTLQMNIQMKSYYLLKDVNYEIGSLALDSKNQKAKFTLM